MSLETLQAKYPVFIDGGFRKLHLREVVEARKESEPRPFIWSARLSTGIFGLTDCKSGNSPYAPKGENEVMLALGDEGLEALVDLGFLPCPTCHPEETPDFWKKAGKPILSVYSGLIDPREILDRDLIPFDARGLNWEAIAPYISAPPNRLYVPPGLQEDDLSIIKKRFDLLGFKLPPVGYYDHTSPTRFTEYNIK